MDIVYFIIVSVYNKHYKDLCNDHIQQLISFQHTPEGERYFETLKYLQSVYSESDVSLKENVDFEAADTLSINAETVLENKNVDPKPFRIRSGNKLQQILHQENRNILNDIGIIYEYIEKGFPENMYLCMYNDAADMLIQWLIHSNRYIIHQVYMHAIKYTVMAGQFAKILLGGVYIAAKGVYEDVKYLVTHPIKSIKKFAQTLFEFGKGLVTSPAVAELALPFLFPLESTVVLPLMGLRHCHPLCEEKRVEYYDGIAYAAEHISAQLSQMSYEEIASMPIRFLLECALMHYAIKGVCIFFSKAAHATRRVAHLARTAKNADTSIIEPAKSIVTPKKLIVTPDEVYAKTLEELAQVAKKTKDAQLAESALAHNQKSVSAASKAIVTLESIQAEVDAINSGKKAYEIYCQYGHLLDPKAKKLLDYTIPKCKHVPGFFEIATNKGNNIIVRRPDGPATRVIKCGLSDPIKGRAGTCKGSVFELEVASRVLQEGGEISEFGFKTKVGKEIIDYDIKSSTRLIECKAIPWKKLRESKIERYQKQFLKQSIGAKNIGMDLELHSRYHIPNFLKKWFIEKNIKFYIY